MDFPLGRSASLSLMFFKGQLDFNINIQTKKCFFPLSYSIKKKYQLYKCARVIVTKHHRLGSFDNISSFSQFWRQEAREGGVDMVGSFQGL